MALNELELLQLEKLKREQTRRQQSATSAPEEASSQGQVSQPAQQPSMASSILRNLLRSSNVEQMNTAAYLKNNPPPPPEQGETMMQYQQRVSQSLQPREQQIANEGVMAQSALPAEGALTVTGLPIVKALKPLMKWENRLQQSRTAKAGLDFLRDKFGQAVDLAIQEVKDVPVKVNMSKLKIPDKVLDVLKNKQSVYDFQFTKQIEKPAGKIVNEAGKLLNEPQVLQEGGKFIQTVGNVNRLKKATGELITNPKFWEEASKTEQAQIKRFYGVLSNIMKNGAKTKGVDLSKPLGAYDKFIDRYTFVNPTLVNAQGHAIGNKLRTAFQIGAEPAVKEAWKAVAKDSPEIRKVMGSRERREILKNLIKFGGGGTVAIGGGAAVFNAVTK